MTFDVGNPDHLAEVTRRRIEHADHDCTATLDTQARHEAEAARRERIYREYRAAGMTPDEAVDATAVAVGVNPARFTPAAYEEER